MGDPVEREQKDAPLSPGLEAYLITMEAVGMPLHQILPMAEQEGMPLSAMVDWADGYLKRVAWVDEPRDAVVLVFGCVRGWKPLLPLVRQQGTVLLQALLMGYHGRLESLASLRDADFFQTFRTRVLRRLGYPTCLAQSHRIKVTSQRHLKRVMAWLGSDGPVLAYDLALVGFQATSPTWGTLHAPVLELRKGSSPEIIDWKADLSDPIRWNRSNSLHIQRVKGFKHLHGSTYGEVRLQDCPDLETLSAPCNVLQAEDCPRLKSAWVGTRSTRLHLRHCKALESIQPWGEEYPSNSSFGSDWIFELEELLIEDCGGLRSLPPRLHIKKYLHLQGVGPIEAWPWDFQVGETFLISDCPGLATLPAVEVQGSLIVTGESGLRRLSPGTVIGKNLDLRACTQLEDFPRGLKVSGNIYLPEHLNHRRRHLLSDPMLECELLASPPPDLYEELRSLLMVLRFPALLTSQKHLASRERAEESLALFRTQVAQEPRFEALLLWTASEVWRDLAEEAWAASNPMAEGRNEADDDLPMAWFLELVRE